MGYSSHVMDFLEAAVLDRDVEPPQRPEGDAAPATSVRETTRNKP